MDRIQFVNSINHNEKQLIQFIPRFIDQYMVLYNLVEENDRVKYLCDNGINQITFQVYSDPDSISNIIRKISTSCDIRLYEHVVHINHTIVSNVILNIQLILVYNN